MTTPAPATPAPPSLQVAPTGTLRVVRGDEATDVYEQLGLDVAAGPVARTRT